jgi:hypothetical protein
MYHTFAYKTRPKQNGGAARDPKEHLNKTLLAAPTRVVEPEPELFALTEPESIPVPELQLEPKPKIF